MAPARIDSETSLHYSPSIGINPRTRVGINGFGRIGRVVFRASLLRSDLQVVAINHTCASIEDVIHQICFDSTHGPIYRDSKTDIESIFAIDEHTLSVQGNIIHLFSQRDPSKINWKESGADYVIESTGKFTSTQLASVHVQVGGAKRVVISAPSKDAATFVYGVNHHDYVGLKPTVISCASCTTNCLAPMAKIINDEFGITQGLMTTVHASTRSQHVLDGYSKRDRRAGRAVLGNVIPTTTGAAKAVARVLPELAGKLTGISLRVPICNVSLVDLTLNLEKQTSLSEILNKLEEASKGIMRGVLSVENDELVSCDFQGNSSSCVIDAKGCVELNDKFFKILAWYDNEWAYSSRLLDMLSYMAKFDLSPKGEALRQGL